MAPRKAEIKKSGTSLSKKMRSPHILIVDDEPVSAAAIRRAFRTFNPRSEVRVAGSLQEFRNAIAKSIPDIALMKMRLPDGKVIQVLTSPPESGQFPIVMMTGQTNKKFTGRALKAGAFDFVVTTPGAIPAIPHTIDRVLREWKLIQERILMENILHTIEQEYHDFFDNAVEGMFHTSPEGRLIHVNTACARLLGFQSPEEATRELTDITRQLYVNPSDRENVLHILREKGSLNNFECQLRKRDGSIIWVSMNSRLNITQRGDRAIEGFITDITDRKHAEDALRESEEKYRSIVEQSMLGIGISRQNQIVFANTTLLKIFNYSDLDEFKNIPLMDHVAPSSRSVIADRMRMAAEGKILPPEFEYDILCKDGSIKTLHASSTHLSIGGEVYTQTAFLDISGRRRMVELLENEHNLLRTLVDALPDNIYVKDKESRFIGCNKAAARRFGAANPDEILGKSDFDFFPHELAQRYYDEEQNIITSGQSIINREEYTDESAGAPHWCAATKVPLRDKDGSVMGIVGIGRDITEQKHTEMMLRENEQFFRLLFTTSPDSILLFDPLSTPIPWKIIDCNDVACRMSGYTREELIGKSVDMLLTKALTREEREAHVKKLQVEGVITFETMHRHRDGHHFPIEVASSIVTLGGRPLVLGIDREITERRRAETELAKTQALLRSAIEQSPVPMALVQPNGIATIINPACKEILGIVDEPDIKTGMDFSTMKPSWQDFTPDGTPIPLNELPLALALQGKATKGQEMKVRRKDGTERWEMVDGVPIYDKHGSLIAGLVIFPDITERKRAEEALRESEQKYRELIDGMNETVWIIDFDGNLIDVNKSAIKVLGYSKEELLARGLPGIDSSLKKEEIVTLAKTMPADTVQIFETSHTSRDGRTFPVEVCSSLVTYQGKKAILSIARNITERKLTEEQIRQMQKMESLGTLAGGIAHDFNNILGIILAYITTIRRFRDDNEKFDLAAATIMKAVERGRTLVQQVLTFARKTETDIAPVNVNNLVMEIMAMISETFPKVITFEQYFDRDIPAVNADRSQLHQALLNLCVNARDAMPNGGTLTINTHAVSGASIHPRHPDAPESTFVCIEVGDTGAGMTDKTRERVFEPFFTTKEKGRGTGLGLAVVFGIVQNHRGYIDVESEPGKGSRLRLYIPGSHTDEPISVETDEKIENIPGGSETVLIVEDEETLADFLQHVLSEKGYTVRTAGDGLMALTLYRENQNAIDLVLTDFGMPKITGLEVCRQIKQINPGAHIILTTGYLDPEVKSESEKAGIERFLFKPYHLKDVLRIIREVLDGK